MKDKTGLFYPIRTKQVRATLPRMRHAINEGLRVGWWELPMRLNLQSLWEEPEFKSMLAELETDMIMRRETITDSTGDTIIN